MGADTNNVKVTCMENGPYLFEGLRSIKNAKGEEIQLTSKAALCRCGESSNKPFCDGSHRSEGFRSEIKARKIWFSSAVAGVWALGPGLASREWGPPQRISDPRLLKIQGRIRYIMSSLFYS